MVTFVIPTRNRPRALARTLDMLGMQPPAHVGPDAEVIVVDNASSPPVDVPVRLANGLPVTVLRPGANLGASARTLAATVARTPWLVMLDDDSAPTLAPFASVLPALPPDVAAVGGEIVLPSGRREAGGLPEVVVGCGCAVRRDAFLAVGGYDPAYEYYVEEYDLCAKLIAAGSRVVHTRHLAFEHRKVDAGRSFAAILHRLVRNNGWTIRRYAPDEVFDPALAAMRSRYRAIADREGVAEAFAAGDDELARTIDMQPRRPLAPERWDRFTGAAAVRAGLVPRLRALQVESVRTVARGKGADVVDAVLHAHGITVDPDAPTAVVATLSPGPMLDAVERHGDGTLPGWDMDDLGKRDGAAPQPEAAEV
jgi:GT2 family glycosyltransferase